MNDLIDKVALMDALAKRVPYVIDTPDEVAFAQGLEAAYQCVVDAPSAPAEVVRYGRWEHKNNSATCTRIGAFEEWFRCYLCYAEVDQEYPNCPYYTARMDGQGEGDSNED